MKIINIKVKEIKPFVMKTRTLKVDNETVNQQGKESVLVFLKE